MQEECSTETDKELTADTTVYLKELGSYRSAVQVCALLDSYKMFLEVRHSCDDKVPRYFVQFCDMMATIDLYKQCMREGVAVIVELLLLE